MWPWLLPYMEAAVTLLWQLSPPRSTGRAELLARLNPSDVPRAVALDVAAERSGAARRLALNAASTCGLIRPSSGWRIWPRRAPTTRSMACCARWSGLHDGTVPGDAPLGTEHTSRPPSHPRGRARGAHRPRPGARGAWAHPPGLHHPGTGSGSWPAGRDGHRSGALGRPGAAHAALPAGGRRGRPCAGAGPPDSQPAAPPRARNPGGGRAHPGGPGGRRPHGAVPRVQHLRLLGDDDALTLRPALAAVARFGLRAATPQVARASSTRR
ncbi:MAG: hypothetical protein R3F43_02310 [bacterium]